MSIKENLCKNGWVDHKKTVSFTMERKSPGQRNFSVIKILFVYHFSFFVCNFRHTKEQHDQFFSSRSFRIIHQTLVVMHQSFVTTAPPPTGKGGDCDLSAFSALLPCYKPHPQGVNWRS